MTTTTSFTTAMRTDIPLVYRCEHCGQDVQMIYPLRTEYGWASAGSAAANSALKEKFEQAAVNAILEKMGKELAGLDETFNKQRRYDCLDGFISAGKCPHCKKKQTWYKLSGNGEERAAGDWIGVFAGVFLGIAVFAAVQSLFPAMKGFAALLIIAVFSATGLFVGKAQGISLAKSRKTKLEEWIAHAPKEQIPQLLVERRSTPRFIDAGLRGMYDM